MNSKKFLKIDSSLIISRLQQKELLDIQRSADFDARFFPLVTVTRLLPNFSSLSNNVSLDLQLLGSTAISAQAVRGYFSQGIEDKLTSLSPYDAICAIGRLNLSSPIFYQLAALMALQALIDEDNSEATKLHFAIALELARIGHHTMVLKNVMLCLELSSIADLIQDLNDLLKTPIATLSRVHQQDQSHAGAIPLLDTTDAIFDALVLMDEIARVVSYEDKLANSFLKKAIITPSLASSFGLTGPYLRANRIHYDTRFYEPLKEIYGNALVIALTDGGDGFGRLVLRILEITESLRWLRSALHRFEKVSSKLGPITISKDLSLEGRKYPFAFFEVEGPEGVIKVGVFSSNVDNLLTFRVRTPAYFIAQSLPYLLADIDIKDLPLMLHSLGIFPEEIDK